MLLSALPLSERPLWALALYAGLRPGELMALRWEDVDLATGVIRVERACDVKEGVAVEPKSRSGRRRVPIAAALETSWSSTSCALRVKLVLPRQDGSPLNPTTSSGKAKRAWRRVGLDPITLHEARHTFASLMIAAGVNAKALCSYMGHASVTITYDRYGISCRATKTRRQRFSTRTSSGRTLARDSLRSRTDPPTGPGGRFVAVPARPAIRQLFASEHPDQWTLVDFGGLRAALSAGKAHDWREKRRGRDSNPRSA